MKLGFYNQNECVLRAKINNNINKKNFFLKNPVMYRIIYKKHFKTKNK
ncbi:MAG: hypothetical protein ABUS76_00015 [Candidatus Shikimatogenerans sp. Ttur]|uniref:Ribosomal protein L33 n=1 Tax=Candidatus Shikimatogenerans sp. Ttur TaxID=3158569 RepID=A0AAU7ZXG6_9FLAO